MKPLDFYRAGYVNLISVIPPGAELAPGSRMQASSLGKAPGRRLPNGLWTGYGWRAHDATTQDIEQWEKDGASFGLRADAFPGLDIDVLDEALAVEIEGLAKEVLGAAPARFGRRPKRLLIYRNFGEPIGRMRLWLERGEESHLIELLGTGQQYLIAGIHPVTGKPYEWDINVPPVFSLAQITRAQVDELFNRITKKYSHAWRVYREGDGYARANAPADQAALRAPSIDTLRELVDSIPNDDAHYPGRDAYIRMGYAIRAAAGDEVEEGYEVFASWATRHTKDARVQGNEGTWRADYSRMRPPFAIGWPWLLNEAQRCGRNTAQSDFDAIAPFQPLASVTYAPADRLTNGDDAGHFYEEFLEHPELLEHPPELVPKLAWAGHKTLLSGREKIGKSTLLLAGVLAATKGEDFLGTGTTPQLVVWLTESKASTLRYAHNMGGAALNKKMLFIEMGKEPPLQLAQAIGRWRPGIVVIDTLYRYASVEDENNASLWRPFLENFDRVTQNGGALVLITHALKAHEDGRYRGSSALGAWVDVIIEMANPQPESSVRRLTCKGRVDAEPFSVRLDQGQFRLLTEEQKQDMEVEKTKAAVLQRIQSGQAPRAKKWVTEALEKEGLIFFEKRKWRATTMEERAQREMRQ